MDSGQKTELTLEELSRSTGEPEERLRQWRSKGLIGAEDREGFRPEDVEKVRLVQTFLRRGIGLEAVNGLRALAGSFLAEERGQRKGDGSEER